MRELVTVRVQVAPTAGDHVEELTFGIIGDSMVFSWESLRLALPIAAAATD